MARWLMAPAMSSIKYYCITFFPCPCVEKTFLVPIPSATCYCIPGHRLFSQMCCTVIKRGYFYVPSPFGMTKVVSSLLLLFNSYVCKLNSQKRSGSWEAIIKRVRDGGGENQKSCQSKLDKARQADVREVVVTSKRSTNKPRLDVEDRWLLLLRRRLDSLRWYI